MSKTVKIGTGLLLLGIAGFFYFADTFFATDSGLWYFTIIASIITATVGLVLVWKEWPQRRK
ncbi:hypothetical protein ACFLVC_03835 [Chloroflexota bacterium]